MKRWILLLALLISVPSFVYVANSTVSTTVPRNDYVGNGSTATYSYTFKIFAADDLRVTVRDTSNVETTLVYPTNYTVTGVGKSSGGTITLVAGNLTSGYALTIRFDRTPRQSTDLRNQGGFFAQTHEDKFDELTRYSQQNKDALDRSLKLPETEAGTSVATKLPVAAARASKFLGFDSSGNPIAAAGTSSNLGPVSSFINTLLDDIDAATARATLGITSLSTLDSDFRIKGSVDVTKLLAFEVDGFTTGTTRTITPPNHDLTMANIWVGQNDFRLSLTSGTPVTTSDVTGAGTIYAVPYVGNRIALYNGTAWVLRNSAQFSLAMTLTSGKPYDVFCYDNSGTPTLEVLVWTNDTTRATALTRQDGVLVKSGDATRRYLGSLYASGVNTTEDSLANRYLWNYYHRAQRSMRHAAEGTNTWTYTTNTFRQANANTANQLNFIIGVAGDIVHATVRGVSYNSSANINRAVGIGLDSTTVDSSKIRIATGSQSAINVQTHDTAEYREAIAEGKHSLMWIEISQAAGATTWLGDDGGVYNQTGIYGSILN